MWRLNDLRLEQYLRLEVSVLSFKGSVLLNTAFVHIRLRSS